MTLVLPTFRWVASPNYSSRGGQRVRLIVAHDCEGSYAGSISWFTQTRSRVSAHIVLREDGQEATQMVAWANKAWHVVVFNPVSEGIEMAGYAAKGFPDVEWNALAAVVAFRLHANGLPCRWAEKGIGEGYCSHYDLGAAGGGHHDPTTDPAVWRAFMARVEAAYAQEMPTMWGDDGHGHGGHDLVYGTLEWVQMSLNALYVSRAPLIVDGIDGPQTRAAIMAYQRQAGLVVDGIAGPQTCAALEKALGNSV